MTYHISLSHVSIVVGLLMFFLFLPGLVSPEKTRLFWFTLPRHFWIGVALTVISILWTVGLLMKVDLGEFSIYRKWLAVAVIVLGILMIQYLRDFLTARAVGFLLLLGAEVLLSAAFPVESKSRLVITVLAYIWAIQGMIYVAAPYRFRDQIKLANKTLIHTRLSSLAHLLFGVVLVGLGFFVYSHF